MTRARFSIRMAAVIAAAAIASACSVHKQETPSLTGPSELGRSITVTVNPDVLAQDGQSQSLVSIVARDANGQPIRSLTLRADVAVGGAVTSALGTLSARTLQTDANGQASVTYTAPRLPGGPGASAAGTIQILVTPSEGDFANSTSRSVNIRLVVPPGVGGGPASPLKPDFTVPAVAAGDPAVFSATVVDAGGADASGQVNNYFWDFGDGDSGTGRTTQHTFDSPGTFGVTLIITDNAGRDAQAFHTVTVSAGVNPTATITVSPSAPLPSQQIFFNASASKPAPGHSITSYAWDFGDGTSGSGVQTSHAYASVGSYTVTLVVTDDVGRTGVISQTVTVGDDTPTADFTFLPASPTAGTSVAFNGTTSSAVAGRTISSYTWTFGDGATASGPTATHPFVAAGVYNVTLTVIDSQGKSKSKTLPVTVTP